MKNIRANASNSNSRIYPDTSGAGFLEHIARIEGDPQISARIDAQQAADRAWFDAHSQRSLYLRKARAWERLPDDAFANVVLVIKITSEVRTRIPLHLRNKPIQFTLAEWIERRNADERELAETLARDPHGRSEMIEKLRKELPAKLEASAPPRAGAK